MKKRLFFMIACALKLSTLSADNESVIDCPEKCQARPVYLNPQIYQNSRIYDSFEYERSRVRGSFPGNHDSAFYEELTR